MTRPEDVRAAIEAGVDAFGVVFDRGPKRVTRGWAEELLKAAHGAPVERIAVVGTAPHLDREEIGQLGFDVIQAVGTDELIRQPGSYPLLPVFFDDVDLLSRIEAWTSFGPGSDPRTGSLAHTVAVDGKGGGGTGVRADWGRARAVAQTTALTLSGGLRVDNLEMAIRTVQPHAVDVCSGVESAPGVKDHAGIRAFVREVRRIEALLDEEAA